MSTTQFTKQISIENRGKAVALLMIIYGLSNEDILRFYVRSSANRIEWIRQCGITKIMKFVQVGLE